MSHKANKDRCHQAALRNPTARWRPRNSFRPAKRGRVIDEDLTGVVDDLGNSLAPNSQCDTACYRKLRITLSRFIVAPVSLLRPPKVLFN
ncbi:uncharacterized protein ARMOST_19842 [Armillaria ostoyae]|uniref:Uncharacterized protein n=1 Tax=Armillaria ostoyae TaxID=47428 RepID=A0A284S5M8_ARMOS|nr:uncharacterized protein ARMOST_19842 [Armillaria ostoyae]